MADKHVADGESGFMAINSTPDACKVGNAVVPFDCFQYLSSKKQYATTVNARGFSVLNVGSIIAGTKSNAGSGVISSTSLGSGDCIILTGSPTVRVEGKPIARHDSSVGMNNQNCLGKLQTFVAPPVVIVKDNSLPCNQSPVSSPWLEKLKEAKKRAEEDNGFGDEIKQADDWTAKQIDKLRPVPMPGKPGDMIYDHELRTEISIEAYNARDEVNAGVLRGVLGAVRSTVSGVVSLVNDLPQVTDKAALNSMILAENIRLGNVCLESMKKDMEDVWEAAKELPDIAEKIWDNLEDQWDKASPGDKAELVGRGFSELAAAFIPSNWISKAGKATKASEITKTAAAMERKSDDLVSAVSNSEDIASIANKTSNATEKAADDVKSGVKVKRPPRRKVPCFHPFDKDKFINLSADEKKAFLKEYARQLRGQQDAINSMTADEFKAARDVFKDMKRSGAAKAQRDTRARVKEDIKRKIFDKMVNENPGMSLREIDAVADQKAAKALDKLAALHEPDLVAGGNGNDPTKMGDRGVNSSIGASWNQEDRLWTLDDTADRHINSGNGSEKMNIELELCRGNGLR